MKTIRTSLDSLLLFSMTDLTDRNEAERQAVLQRSEIAHLSRVTILGEVAGSIAHELNQPLTAIMTNA
jgi:C4-dicarboxylate-specific signal transduction histidine kinase